MLDDALASIPSIPLVSVQFDSAAKLAKAWIAKSQTLTLPSGAVALPSGAPVALSVRVEGHPGRLIVNGRIASAAKSSQAVTLTERDVVRLLRAIETIQSSPGAPFRQERYITDEPVVHVHHDGSTIEGRIINVSDGGCFVGTEGALPAMGAAVVLEIKAPDKIFGVKVSAVVMRQGGEGARGFGAKFDDGQGARLERFIYAAMVTI